MDVHSGTRTAIVSVIVGLTLSFVQAQPSTRVEWSVRPNLAPVYRDGSQGFLLENAQSIDFELFILNDEESPKSFVLNEGFIRNVEVTLRDGNDRVVATNSGWKPEGHCPDLPKCASTRRISLRPAQGATFSGTFVTMDREPLGEGEYYVLITMSPIAAQRFTGTEDGTHWQGLTENPRPIRFVVPHTAEDRRLSAYTRASQASAKGDYAGALRIYEQIIALTPNDAVALVGAGQILLRLHRFSEAVTMLERVVPSGGKDLPRVNPENRAASTLVITYYALGQDAKAERLLQRMYRPDQMAEAIRNSKAAAARAKAAR
jgi:hypothetical protein